MVGLAAGALFCLHLLHSASAASHTQPSLDGHRGAAAPSSSREGLPRACIGQSSERGTSGYYAAVKTSGIPSSDTRCVLLSCPAGEPLHIRWESFHFGSTEPDARQVLLDRVLLDGSATGTTRVRAYQHTGPLPDPTPGTPYPAWLESFDLGNRTQPRSGMLLHHEAGTHAYPGYSFAWSCGAHTPDPTPGRALPPPEPWPASRLFDPGACVTLRQLPSVGEVSGAADVTGKSHTKPHASFAFRLYGHLPGTWCWVADIQNCSAGVWLQGTGFTLSPATMDSLDLYTATAATGQGGDDPSLQIAHLRTFSGKGDQAPAEWSRVVPAGDISPSRILIVRKVHPGSPGNSAFGFTLRWGCVQGGGGVPRCPADATTPADMRSGKLSLSDAGRCISLQCPAAQPLHLRTAYNLSWDHSFKVLRGTQGAEVLHTYIKKGSGDVEVEELTVPGGAAFLRLSEQVPGTTWGYVRVDVAWWCGAGGFPEPTAAPASPAPDTASPPAPPVFPTEMGCTVEHLMHPDGQNRLMAKLNQTGLPKSTSCWHVALPACPQRTRRLGLRFKNLPTSYANLSVWEVPSGATPRRLAYHPDDIFDRMLEEGYSLSVPSSSAIVFSLETVSLLERGVAAESRCVDPRQYAADQGYSVGWQSAYIPVCKGGRTLRPGASDAGDRDINLKDSEVGTRAECYFLDCNIRMDVSVSLLNYTAASETLVRVDVLQPRVFDSPVVLLNAQRGVDTQQVVVPGGAAVLRISVPRNGGVGLGAPEVVSRQSLKLRWSCVPPSTPVAAPGWAELLWCRRDADCWRFGDSLSTCSAAGRCRCNAPYAGVGGVGGAGVCVKPATSVNDRLRVTFGTSCAGIAEGRARHADTVSMIVAVLTSASVAQVMVECGTGTLTVIVSLRQASVSKLFTSTLYGAIAAGLSQPSRNETAAALGDVLSVTVDWVAHLQCHIDHAEGVTLRSDRCTATSCQQGYSVSADATRCDQIHNASEDSSIVVVVVVCSVIAVAVFAGVYFYSGRTREPLQCDEGVGQEGGVENTGVEYEADTESDGVSHPEKDA